MQISRLARLTLFSSLIASAPVGAAVDLMHMHGLAYSPDGKRILVSIHQGLAAYENGKWSKPAGPQHDYMGFSATAKNLYSSGHPAPGSGLANPLGLMRSRDGGKSWERLGMQGETDFHLMAASWNTNAIYVWNPAPSSRIKAPGLHSTEDDGETWQPARAQGLAGDPRALAVHTQNPAIVAVATSSGVYLSRDSGERFAPVAAGAQAVSVFFDLDGAHLWFGTFDGQAARLARVRFGVGKPQNVELPQSGPDAVAYIAQNPMQRNEYALATFERSVYVSKDAGRTWTPIAVRGNGK